jgi:hypothetical protein
MGELKTKNNMVAVEFSFINVLDLNQRIINAKVVKAENMNAEIKAP